MDGQRDRDGAEGVRGQRAGEGERGPRDAERGHGRQRYPERDLLRGLRDREGSERDRERDHAKNCPREKRRDASP